MSKYGFENSRRFSRTGVTPEDVKIMKMEAVDDAFEGTKEDFENLVEQLADGIKEGRWSAILGDDVSGRFVALVIGKLASRYAREHNQEVPKRIFFAGGGIPYEDIPKNPETGFSDKIESNRMEQEQQHKLEEYIHHQSKNLGNTVLFVTEHVVKGRTLRRIAKALHKEGIIFDIASLWSTDRIMHYKTMLEQEDESELFEGVQYYFGQENAHPSDPWGSRILSGYYDLGIPLNEATKIKKVSANPFTERDIGADNDLVLRARHQVYVLTSYLYSKYFVDKT